MKYPNIFHIGCLKSGTTTLQEYLAQDERINLILKSRYFNTSKWDTENYEYSNSEKINIESDENISRKFKKLLGLEEALKRIQQVAPDAKIILTIREQKSAILSMYKHFIRQTNSTLNLNEFLKAEEGKSYLDTIFYYDTYKLINTYFKKSNIYIYFFENMFTNWDDFISTFYHEIFNIEIDICRRPGFRHHRTDPGWQ